MKPFLVDTSAWILSFSANPPVELKKFLDVALEEDHVQTCGVVIAELLQGCRKKAAQQQLADRLTALHYLPWPESDWVTLGETSAKLRSHGVNAPLTDIMIAVLALRHHSTIIHRDRHFDLIAKHLPITTERF